MTHLHTNTSTKQNQSTSKDNRSPVHRDLLRPLRQSRSSADEALDRASSPSPPAHRLSREASTGTSHLLEGVQLDVPWITSSSVRPGNINPNAGANRPSHLANGANKHRILQLRCPSPQQHDLANLAARRIHRASQPPSAREANLAQQYVYCAYLRTTRAAQPRARASPGKRRTRCRADLR